MGITQYIHQSNDFRYTFFNLALRLVTGLLLLLKGIYFVSHSQQLEAIIMSSNARPAVTFLVGYITFAHLFGGAFIMLGLLTRFAVILQIPILIGALYFNLTPNAFGTGGELLLSIVVLVLLIYVLLYGSGHVSMDDYLKKHLL
ncbi:DoxX family protein [Segetibacter koreensis]|uniref:DoxX family protein n=1 Tax=Segetibacter koreensis TaxID=398037 RepID=UPI0003A587F9|nr:DoxX family protein [Segetibacter koreensis]